MSDNLRSLKEAIHIRNEFNRIAAPILEHVKEASKPFIGKKVDTLKGLASKYADAIQYDCESVQVKPLPGAKRAKLRYSQVSANSGDMSVRISLCFGDWKGTGCVYEERSFWFGKIENSILLSINEDCKVSNTVLDFNEELEKIKAFRALEKLAEEAEEKILINREAYKYLKDI